MRRSSAHRVVLLLSLLLPHGGALAWGQLGSLTPNSRAKTDPPPGRSIESLTPGTRIRVRAGPNAKPLTMTGTLVGVEDDSLLQFFSEAHPGEFVSVPLAGVERVDVYAGRKSKWTTGAGIGAGTLALAGGIAGYAAGGDSFFGPGATAAGAALLGAVSGFVLGGAVGAFIHTDRWREVSTQRLSVGLGPTPSGPVGLTVTLRF